LKKSIPLGSLSIGEPLAQDIYDEQNRLLLKAGTHLSDQYITSLQAKGIETVLVAIVPKISNGPKAEKTLKKKTVADVADFKKPYDDLLYEQNRVKLRGYNIKKIHKEFNIKTREFADLILTDPEAALEFYLQTKRSQTEYNYEEHHVNTGILATLISNWLGLNKHIIYEIMNVAMLHDIGETRISPNILQKPGSLDRDEMATVQTHPSIGFKILCKTDWLSNRELLGVLTHHERLNGLGYPNKLLGSQIIIHSRVTAVASIFNAATTDRPYATAKNPVKVLSELRDRSYGELDSKVTRVLYEKLYDLFPKLPG
jgi:HD-GYP domain-containing protein (c-di-GMP phosphodiesterase class II)